MALNHYISLLAPSFIVSSSMLHLFSSSPALQVYLPSFRRSQSRPPLVLIRSNYGVRAAAKQEILNYN